MMFDNKTSKKKRDSTKVKLYELPTPYDYHEEASIVIASTSKEEAKKKLKLLLERGKIPWPFHSWVHAFVNEDEGELIEHEDVYINMGCDC